MNLRLQLQLCTSLALSAGAASACGNGDSKADIDPDLAQEQASQLAQEVFQLVDRAVEYAGSGRARSANELRDIGSDSLTPETARWLESVAGEPVVTVAFRRSASREVTRCSGGPQILEDEAIEGVFRVTCSLRDGTEERFTVERTGP